MIHELKIKKKNLIEIMLGNKMFEVRENDRNFKVGDYLLLKELDNNIPTGNYQMVKVTYLLEDENYCKKGFVILGISLDKFYPKYVARICC